MDKHQAAVMISVLSAKFNIPKPNYKLLPSGKNGRYSPGRNLIWIGMKCWYGIENIILHEFAHALTNARYGVIKTSKYRTEWHGAKFARCLIEIIDVWYGNQEKYCWGKEYKSLRAYGPRK